MKEPESSSSAGEQSSTKKNAARPALLRRILLRHLPLTAASIAVLAILAVAGLLFWASSSSFENLVRRHLIAILEKSTGARVEISAFHWHLLHLDAEADGIVLHGREAAGEEPYASIASLHAGFSWLGFWSPRFVSLRELVLSRPEIHLIVYPDGTTNQPTPPQSGKKSSSTLDTLFDLKASRLSVQQGMLHYENRAAAFDFQNRHIPLDFAANDLSLRMSYQAKHFGTPEFFRIEAGASDLILTRGAAKDNNAKSPGKLPQVVQGRLQATLDLGRDTAVLHSLRLTTRSSIVKEQSLEVTGALSDFSRPRWQGKVAGVLDMRLLDALTGYPFAPQGLAHLNLALAGQGGVFRIDGGVHIDNGAYIGTGIYSTGIQLDAHVHADAEQLLITSILARLRQGGQIEGTVALDHWLPPMPGAAQLRAANTGHAAASSSGDITIPVNGKVTAQFKNVALDTILEMTAQPPFQHLGFDARLNGPAVALWNNGDNLTLSVNSTLTLTAPDQVAPGKVAASGVIDGTYTQRDGAVALRALDLHLPASHVQASGHLGAYPLNSPSNLNVDFQTANLAEFDTVLRDLGLARNGKSGAEALPIHFSGPAEYRGVWTGSLIDPHLTGFAQATNLTAEVPDAHGTLHNLQWDSLQATGSYSAAHINIDHGALTRGSTSLVVSGTLDSATHTATPNFDGNSLLHLRANATKVELDQLLTLAGVSAPLTGALDAQLGIDGPLHALGGSGVIDLNQASVYGEPFSHIHGQGSLAGKNLTITSLSAIHPAGRFSAEGSLNLASRSFRFEARGSNLAIEQIDKLRRQNLAASGKLTFAVSGEGTLGDPHLDLHASLANLVISGQSLGGLTLTAHTVNGSALYDLTTNLGSTQLAAHGQTALSGDFVTKAQLDFSHFDIGTLFKLIHGGGISAESALSGTLTLNGPLAHPKQMRGDLRINPPAFTIAGVHLHSDTAAHAVFADARIQLDPLHIIGDETDLHAQGWLTLEDKPLLDFFAGGTINLKLAETLDPDLTATGTTTFEVEAHGPLASPALRGHVDIQDASLSLEDLPNGLSHLHGSLEFNQNRLEVKSLTAMSGGGLLSVTGFLAYQRGLYADLSVKGQEIRIRYPQGVSSLADVNLHLQGPQSNLLLSGDVLITRFSVSPDLDVAALTAEARNVQAVAPPDAPSNHIRLDIHFRSSPQLNFQNAYAKLAGDVDLHLRGTVASPSLLGRVSITEGSATIAGTRYELQRGEITFTNPVRIQPNIDLNATARVEDYDITLGIHGTLDRPTITYRSDPPLPEADVVALLALGRTEDQQRIYTQQQEQSGATPTDALLNGALNATVSSRVQKLFGAGSVKVDPNYLGPLGNSTSRVIVEEQLGGNVTLTYATNVNTTAQQLIQAEIAINRHVSLLVARDESGVFSMVLKATRRYR